MLKQKLCSLSVAAGLYLAAQPLSTHAAPADSNRIVVMISIDGLAAYYIDDPKSDVPTLRQLAAEGARASSMRASTPTVTWPNHTTLVTGDNPARHGVVGNNYWDRKAGEKVVLISDPVYDKDQIVKVPTIYDVAKAAGLKTAAVRWPATRNAKTLDWATPDVGTKNLAEHYTTPALAEECEKAGINLLDKDGPGFKKAEGESKDDVYTAAFNEILHTDHPSLALLHVAFVDHTEHLHGPKSPEAYAAIHAADNQVRAVWDELQKEYPGRATLIVVSDHGFSPVDHMILPNITLRKSGLDKNSGIHLVVQGGSVFVYFDDESHRAELIKKVRKAFAGADGVSKIAGPEELKKLGVADALVDPKAPDMMLFAKEGCSFGDTAAGSLPFVDKPERKGSHGHDSSLPDLHATFIMWGAGVKPGVKLGEIPNTDVAPTIAKLLGLDLPDTDGKPLAKALAE